MNIDPKSLYYVSASLLLGNYLQDILGEDEGPFVPEDSFGAVTIPDMKIDYERDDVQVVTFLNPQGEHVQYQLEAGVIFDITEGIKLAVRAADDGQWIEESIPQDISEADEESRQDFMTVIMGLGVDYLNILGHDITEAQASETEDGYDFLLPDGVSHFIPRQTLSLFAAAVMSTQAIIRNQTEESDE